MEQGLFSLKYFLIAILSGWLIAMPAWAQNKGLNFADVGAVNLLEKSERDLFIVFPDLKKVTRPALGPRGERGRWILDGTNLAGLKYATTFFIRTAKIVRVEQLWTSVEQDCANGHASALFLSRTQQQFGIGQKSNLLADNENTQPSVADWVVGDADIALHLSMAPAQCSARLTYKTAHFNDASTL